jgi:hypothetical protein
MGSKSKAVTLFSELLLIKQVSVAYFSTLRGNTFIRIPATIYGQN